MGYLYIFLLLNVMFSMSVWAAEQKNFAELAVDKTWLKLLHMQTLNEPSKVTSSSFFLAKKGSNDAKAELHATIGILDMQSEKKRLQTMCKFPARYLWLSQKLNRADIQQDLQHCTKLQRWVADNDEVSLILVSGYLGNPASTFGHAMLKLQSSKQDKQTILMDTAVNYGAITPESEPTLRYVYKGITGGYKATFLDKYYYTQELMYSRLESRDMWVYTLNLDNYKTRLLMYHIWELLGQKFDYYFLDENCAYQLADVLSLVLDEPMVEKAAWYVPVEAFYRLEYLDHKYREEGRDELIKSVTFLPSSQRKLSEQLTQLNQDEIKAMQLLMDEKYNPNLSDILKGLPQHSQMKLLDAGLTYYNYQYVKSGLKPSQRDKAMKRDILLARFNLPVSQQGAIQYTTLPPPTQGFSPILLGVGWGYGDYQSSYTNLHWAGYHQSSTGKNNLNGDELVLLDIELGLAGTQENIFLHKLDLIRIRKLNHNQMLIRNHDWAWQMRIGLEHKTKQYDGVVSFGAGKTWSVIPSQALYGMLAVSAHSQYPYIRLKPHLGWYSDWGGMKGLFYVGVENTDKNKTFGQVWGGEVQYHVGNEAALVLTYARSGDTQAGAEYRWFW